MALPVSVASEGTLGLPLPAVNRILIADDNPVLRYVLHALIDVNAGLEVCGEAVSGLDAIQLTKDLKPDVVVLDLRMPGMNGLQVAPLLKQSWPSVFIVLFTMFENEISETVRTAAKIDLVLRKPDGMDRLLNSIQKFRPASWIAANCDNSM